jgi:hypothetical protein
VLRDGSWWAVLLLTGGVRPVDARFFHRMFLSDNKPDHISFAMKIFSLGKRFPD